MPEQLSAFVHQHGSLVVVFVKGSKGRLGCETDFEVSLNTMVQISHKPVIAVLVFT